MNRVAALVGRGDYGQALVCLWVLAGQRTADTSLLNAWERERNATAFLTQVEQFRRRLQEETQLTADEIDAAPLAFVTALDEARALDEESLPTFEMPFEEEGAGYWLTRIEIASRRPVPLARQTGNREAWFKRHRIIPVRTSHGMEVRVTVAPRRLAHFLEARIAGGSVTLHGWVGHFRDAARLQWDTSAAGRFRLRRIHPADTRNDSIRESLEQASECGSQVVVLPEFTVDLDGRKVVADWMVAHPEHPFLLVVAGSFHEDTPEGCYNTAEL